MVLMVLMVIPALRVFRGYPVMRVPMVSMAQSALKAMQVLPALREFKVYPVMRVPLAQRV
jgi:hypothetical protein